MFFVVQPIHASKCRTNVYVSILQSHGSVFWCYRMLGLHTHSVSTFSFPTRCFLMTHAGGAGKRSHDATSRLCLAIWAFGSDTMQFQLIFRACKASTAKTSTAFVKVQKAWTSTMSRKRRVVLSNPFLMAAVASRVARLVSHSLQGLTVRCTSSDAWSLRSQMLSIAHSVNKRCQRFVKR